MNASRALAIAVASAAAATIGDLLLLWVGNSLRADLHVERPPDIVLTIGGLLGCLAIPLYAIGYIAIARIVRPLRPTLAMIVAVFGTVFALTGSLTHGLTWMAIRAGAAAGTTSVAPVDAIAGSTGLLLDAWIAAAVLMLVVSAAIAWAGFSLPRALPKWLVLPNPVNMTLLISAAGAATALGRAFVVPAAPNLAHLVFFTAAWFVAARRAHGVDQTR